MFDEQYHDGVDANWWSFVFAYSYSSINSSEIAFRRIRIGNYDWDAGLVVAAAAASLWPKLEVKFLVRFIQQKKNSHNLHFWFAHLKCVDVWFANVWIKYEHVYWTSRKQRPTEIKLTFYFSIQIGFVTRIDHIEEKNGNGEKKKFK